MRTTVKTNSNYHLEKPLFFRDLKEAFGVKSQKDLKFIDQELFGALYQLDTLSPDLDQIDILGFKKRKFKIEEERLILKLFKQKSRDNENAYFIQTGLYAGVVYHQGCQFNITTAYGDRFLQRMLNYVSDIYVDTKDVTAKKNEESNSFQYILAYLFINSLERASNLGLPQQYVEVRKRDNKVRGKIDLNAYLRNDLPFKGKLTSVYKERQYIKEIVDLLYHACKKLEVNFRPLLQSKVHGVYQTLKEHRSGAYPSQEAILKAKEHIALYNPLYAPFKKVLEYAEIILRDLNLENARTQSDVITHGYLFDIAELFELYLEKLLGRNLSNWIVKSQEELRLYDGMFYGRNMYPDLILEHKHSNKVAVFDAKFKQMRGLGKDLDRSDLYQIHTYVQYYQPNVVMGGLLYPLSQELIEEKSISPTLFNKGDLEIPFVIDGLIVDKEMAISDIIESEKRFVSRIEKLLEPSIDLHKTNELKTA